MIEKILKDLSELVSELTQIDQTVDLNSDFVDDCNMSSFQMAMLFCMIEDRFGIIIEDFVKHRKASAVVATVQRNCDKKGSMRCMLERGDIQNDYPL